MASILDQSGDTTRQDFVRYSRLYELPDYVKHASQPAIFDRNADLAATAFADVPNRQYKCATAADTWVSWLYFLEKGQPELHHKVASWVEQRLEGFAEYWGIAADVQALREKHAELNTDHLRDADYMWVWASKNSKDRRYPLRNPSEVKAAADWFLKHRDHFLYSDRQVMADKLLEKSAALGVIFPDSVDAALARQAGRGTYVPKDAAQHIRNRIAAAPTRVDPKCLAGLDKLADKVATNGHLATDASTVAGLCRTLDTFDRLTKLAGAYTQRLPRPEDVFCQALYKEARTALEEACQLTTGNVYNRNDFGDLKLSELRAAFGNEIAESCASGLLVDPQKAAEILATLPRPDAVILDSVLQDNGIGPMGKAATAVERPAFELLKQLSGMGG